MLKAFDDLEKAVSRLLEKTRKTETQSLDSGEATKPIEDAPDSIKPIPSGPDTQEAAELIKRAIKRLKSL